MLTHSIYSRYIHKIRNDMAGNEKCNIKIQPTICVIEFFVLEKIRAVCTEILLAENIGQEKVSTFTYKLKSLWLLLCLVVESLALARLLILSLAQISHLVVVPILILRHLIVRKAFLWRTLAIEMSFDNENTCSCWKRCLIQEKGTMTHQEQYT